jgi:hypothetical protein
MYRLVLTPDERAAIDFVGNRYAHGDELYSLLWGECFSYPETLCWDDCQDIGFKIPEIVAWDIRTIGEECQYRWDCFSPELAEKMTKFCMDIV